MSSSRRTPITTIASLIIRPHRAREPACSCLTGENSSWLYRTGATSALKFLSTRSSEAPMKMIYSLTLTLMALFVGQVHAQTAILSGRILDESGAVVPGAKVALSGAGGFVKTATASSEGSYNFADLPAGNYTVQASAPNL